MNLVEVGEVLKHVLVSVDLMMVEEERELIALLKDCFSWLYEEMKGVPHYSHQGRDQASVATTL